MQHDCQYCIYDIKHHQRPGTPNAACVTATVNGGGYMNIETVDLCREHYDHYSDAGQVINVWLDERR